MANPTIDCRIPHSIKEQVKAIADEKSTTPSGILRAALTEYLSKQKPQAA